MSQYWRCPECGAILKKSLPADKLERLRASGKAITGRATCGKCQSVFKQAHVYDGRYDIPQAELIKLAKAAKKRKQTRQREKGMLAAPPPEPEPAPAPDPDPHDVTIAAPDDGGASDVDLAVPPPAGAEDSDDGAVDVDVFPASEQEVPTLAVTAPDEPDDIDIPEADAADADILQVPEDDEPPVSDRMITDADLAVVTATIREPDGGVQPPAGAPPEVPTSPPGHPPQATDDNSDSTGSRAAMSDSGFDLPAPTQSSDSGMAVLENAIGDMGDRVRPEADDVGLMDAATAPMLSPTSAGPADLRPAPALASDVPDGVEDDDSPTAPSDRVPGVPVVSEAPIEAVEGSFGSADDDELPVADPAGADIGLFDGEADLEPGPGLRPPTAYPNQPFLDELDSAVPDPDQGGTLVDYVFEEQPAAEYRLPREGYDEFRPGTGDAICCDVCTRVLRAPEGYMLERNEVLASGDYTDFVLERWQLNGYLPPGRLPDRVREQVADDLAAQTGDEPWLVCETCILLFPAVRREALVDAATRARDWWPEDGRRPEPTVGSATEAPSGWPSDGALQEVEVEHADDDMDDMIEFDSDFPAEEAPSDSESIDLLDTDMGDMHDTGGGASEGQIDSTGWGSDAQSAPWNPRNSASFSDPEHGETVHGDQEYVAAAREYVADAFGGAEEFGDLPGPADARPLDDATLHATRMGRYDETLPPDGASDTGFEPLTEDEAANWHEPDTPDYEADIDGYEPPDPADDIEPLDDAGDLPMPGEIGDDDAAFASPYDQVNLDSGADYEHPQGGKGIKGRSTWGEKREPVAEEHEHREDYYFDDLDDPDDPDEAPQPERTGLEALGDPGQEHDSVQASFDELDQMMLGASDENRQAPGHQRHPGEIDYNPSAMGIDVFEDENDDDEPR